MGSQESDVGITDGRLMRLFACQRLTKFLFLFVANKGGVFPGHKIVQAVFDNDRLYIISEDNRLVFLNIKDGE